MSLFSPQNFPTIFVYRSRNNWNFEQSTPTSVHFSNFLEIAMTFCDGNTVPLPEKMFAGEKKRKKEKNAVYESTRSSPRRRNLRRAHHGIAYDRREVLDRLGWVCRNIILFCAMTKTRSNPWTERSFRFLAHHTR